MLIFGSPIETRAARGSQEAVDMRRTSLRPSRSSSARHSIGGRPSRNSVLTATLFLIAIAGALPPRVAGPTDAEKRDQYIRAVVRGEGYMPWQEQGLSRK